MAMNVSLTKHKSVLDLTTTIGLSDRPIIAKLTRHHEQLSHYSGDTTLELTGSLTTGSQRISLQEV